MKVLNNPTILFRHSLEEEGEFESCKKNINTVEYRSQIKENSLVIGRYSVLPYYKELEEEIKLKNSKLINAYWQHKYIADIEKWYYDVEKYTPKTWFDWYNLPENKSFVVKGKTNSRKFEWNTRMFAKTKDDVPKIANSLLDDCLIADQGVCVREYVPLQKFEDGINGMPITNEWRFFLVGNRIIDYGYYWSIIDKKAPRYPDAGAFNLVSRLSNIVGTKTNFYVLDVAKTQAGNWILIEINDGQMSGLSTIPPNRFYNNLSEKIKYAHLY